MKDERTGFHVSVVPSSLSLDDGVVTGCLRIEIAGIPFPHEQPWNDKIAIVLSDWLSQLARYHRDSASEVQLWLWNRSDFFLHVAFVDVETCLIEGLDKEATQWCSAIMNYNETHTAITTAASKVLTTCKEWNSREIRSLALKYDDATRALQSQFADRSRMAKRRGQQ